MNIKSAANRLRNGTAVGGTAAVGDTAVGDIITILPFLSPLPAWAQQNTSHI